jgi:hypothetical protein
VLEVAIEQIELAASPERCFAKAMSAGREVEEQIF